MRLPGILGQIVERTLEDVQGRLRDVSPHELEEAAAGQARRRRDFRGALRRDPRHGPVRFLGEVKKASPSKGVLRADLDPAWLAAEYRKEGARAISVVTEPHFFSGDPGFLESARRGARELPLLRKDFHVHELQILETAASEADALLLILAALSPTQLKDYLDMAREFSLDHLVEVTDLKEAETALKAGAGVVGVNNRDLATFAVDLSRTFKVLPLLREADVVSVAESGIRDRATVEKLEAEGVHALLVGEALITAEDPGGALRELRGMSPEPATEEKVEGEEEGRELP
jgi:indole-3-glycerol phosphate synthase